MVDHRGLELRLNERQARIEVDRVLAREGEVDDGAIHDMRKAGTPAERTGRDELRLLGGRFAARQLLADALDRVLPLVLLRLAVALGQRPDDANRDRRRAVRLIGGLAVLVVVFISVR